MENFTQIAEQIRKKYKNKIIGFTCSCFDLLHSGHISLLADARRQCDVLIIGLQTDPSIDRKDKNRPIQAYEDREIMIRAVRHVDEVIKYDTEEDLYELLKELMPDIRIIGTDWRGKPFTGHDLPTPIYWHERERGSTSELRRQVWQAEEAKRALISN